MSRPLIGPNSKAAVQERCAHVDRIRHYPIIFNAAMVRALLADHKTQTRRVITGPRCPDLNVHPNAWTRSGWPWHITKPSRREPTGSFFHTQEVNVTGDNLVMCEAVCPYGRPGDRLWVRETIAIEDPAEYWHNDPRLNPTDRPWKWLDDDHGHRPLIPHYRATDPEPNIVPLDCETEDDRTRWTPSIHMPRWASRITLEITDIKAERLHDINGLDVLAEGLGPEALRRYVKATNTGRLIGGEYDAPEVDWDWETEWRTLWDSINAKRGFGWDVNPWIWVITFRRLPFNPFKPNQPETKDAL